MRLSRGGRIWFGVAVAVSLMLLAATGIRAFLAPTHPARPPLDLLNLGAENNLASWWSGMLLLLASLHAHDGAHAVRHSRPASARAWLVISGLLLFLSVDETASLHEKVSHYVTGEPWLPLGLLGLVLGAVAIASIRELWVSGHRRAALLIFLGFSLLGSIFVQEYLEHNLTWSGTAVQALRLIVEEGTEMAGILLILRATVGNTAGLSHHPTHAVGGPFAALDWKVWTIVLVGVPVSLVLAAISTEMVDVFARQGRLANWFAAAAYLCTAMIVLRPALIRRDLGVGASMLGIAGAGFCAVASAGAVAIDPLAMVEIGPFWFNVRLSVVAIAVGLFAATRFAGSRQWGSAAILLLGAAITGMVGIAFSLWLLGVFLFTQLLALTVLASVAAAPSAGARYSPPS